MDMLTCTPATTRSSIHTFEFSTSHRDVPKIKEMCKETEDSARNVAVESRIRIIEDTSRKAHVLQEQRPG